MKINFFPYVIEALGHNKRIYKDIDKIYQANKYKYYKLAKRNTLYRHKLLKEGSLVQEEYCKKILGIFLGQEENEVYNKKIKDLFKKGFQYTYTYLHNHSTISLEKFVGDFIKKHGGYVDNRGVSIEFHIVILVFLSLNSSVTLVENDFYNGYLSNLKERWDHYKDSNLTRIGLDKAKKDDFEKIKQAKEIVNEKYGSIDNFIDLLDRRFDETKLDSCSFLFDYENLSSVSVFEDIPFTKKDMDEIFYLYVVSGKDLKTAEEILEFIIPNIYIKYLIKSYKKVKEVYFKNNKETTFIELEGLENQLEKLKIELALKEKSLVDFKKHSEELEKENIRLRSELKKEQKNKEELKSLREFIFTLDSQEDFIEEKFDLDILKNYKAVIIGGHEKWQQKMKRLLPDFIFIHPDSLNFDTKLLDSVDHIFIYTNYLNHGIYYKVMNHIADKDIKVEYLSQQNENKVLSLIYKALLE